MDTAVAPAPSRADAGQRRGALRWALLHVPIFLALYASAIGRAVAETPPRFRLALWPTFLPQAALLALLAYLLGLPFAGLRRGYRFAAPAMAGLLTAGLVLDARVYDAVGFHLNGFFVRVMLQPNALRETGILPRDVAIILGVAAALLALEIAAGAWFIRRFASPRPAWRPALVLLLLGAGERVYGATLFHFGGPSIFAASGTLPLQVPLRMETFVAKFLGEQQRDPFAGAAASERLPVPISADEIHLARKPDVVFVVSESLPANHLDAATMPNLWRHAQEGALFANHYASASATHYALFSLMYGLQAQKLEAVVGAGRHPLVFEALARNGYQTKVLAASCVDWMGLKESVFGGQDVETWCEDPAPPERDGAMLGRARAFIAAADPARPVFLFLFFFGTHFDYFYDPVDRVHVPDWDGQGGVKATTAAGSLIANRARNAAHAVDRELESLLSDFATRRGKSPLVVFTGDHGEEFRQKGHIGHASDVTREQINVPAVWFGPGVPHGRFDAVTSHVDVVPTLLELLGDTNPPSRYSDGTSMFEAPQDRFVLATVGWEPRYAVIGKDLKVRMYAGQGAVQTTDLDDRPLPDGDARMAREAGRILRALRGEAEQPRAQATAR